MSVIRRKLNTLIQHPDRVLQVYGGTPFRAVRRALFEHPWSSQYASDGDVYATPRNMNPIDRSALFFGRFEAEELSLLRKFTATSLIIELGSNFGFTARHAIKNKLADGGRYICVEPNPDVQEALSQNMAETHRRFPLRDFTIVAAAVGEPKNDRKGSNDHSFVDFAVRDTLSSGICDYLLLGEKERITSVPSRSLSSLVDEFAPHDRSPLSVICDIEGAEIALALKDRHGFDRVQQLAIELHEPSLTGRSETPAQILATFQEMGFRPLAAANRNCYLLTREAA